ncbi:MAG: DedA family protein [Deltaproteobacteria bacterium]|nr:DedA family protein [Deltaproteobacteria bacterium]
MEYFTEFGYVGLFLAAFAAATVLPLSSEVVLGVLLLDGMDPIVLVGVATCGNVLGAFVNYGIGFWGSSFFARKVLRISAEESSKALARFEKYGVGSLFFAWLPIIGDPLTLIAGILKVNLPIFFLLVTSGKLIRYVVISLAVLA